MRPSVVVLFIAIILLKPASSADEGTPRWDNSAVVGAGLPSFGYEAVDLFPGITLQGAVYAETYVDPKGTHQLLLSSTLGTLHTLPATSLSSALPTPVFDLKEQYGAELRLFSSLFETDLAARPHLYLYFNTRAPGPKRNHVRRYSIASLSPLVLGESIEILTWESGGHNGGDMAWGPDGMLYITAGDRSAPGDPNNWGQRTDDIFGSILRIDVRSDEEPYAIPADNPFIGLDNVRPEIWSYGLRNPWRFCFHPDNNELWVGDNGDESWELLHRIEKGANAGWSAYEGSAIFRNSNKLSGQTLNHTPPMIQHPHSEMRSVIGGLFYRGEQLPELKGHYLYGCYFSKRLWAFSYKDGQVGTPFLIADAGGQVVSITENHDHEPIITCHDGRILELHPKPKTESRPWPEKLSDTGLFDDTGGGSFAPGVHSYLTNAQSWADGADRQHFVAIAGTGSGQMSPTGGAEAGRSWHIPAGSIVGQTLSLDAAKVETQLLHFDGTWRGYTYRWNADGKDATLVPEGGADAQIGDQKWRFLSRAECMSCHTHRSNFTLTLNSSQLERGGPDGTTNQVDHFVALGLLKPSPLLKRERDKPTPNPHDDTLDLTTRVRSYLHLNCAHCHRETGLGGRAGFQLLASLPLEETGILNAKPLVGLTGNPDAKIVAPGHPELSELLTRMSRRSAGQMPLVGSHRVDEEGVRLITDWINQMEKEGAATAPLAPKDLDALKHPIRPLLWTVEGKGLAKASYLFGTIHLPDTRVTTLHPRAAQAFDEADELYTEIKFEAPTEEEKAAKNALYHWKDHVSFTRRAGRDITDRLNVELKHLKAGYTANQLLTNKLWYLATSLPSLPDKLAGRRDYLDFVLWRRAKTAGKKTFALEHPLERVRQLDKLPLADQRTLLGISIELLQIARETEQPVMKDALDAYLACDRKALASMVSRELFFGRPVAPLFGETVAKIMLDDRNAAMAKTIEERLARPDSAVCFFAVGASHFVGRSSICDLLREAGFKVTLVEPTTESK